MARPRVSVRLAAALATGLTGCTGAANTGELRVGDCLDLGSTLERQEAVAVACGSMQSNFKVVAKVANSDQCPVDADSSYTMRRGFTPTVSTVCLDIDWVVGGCMSVHPASGADPVRVDCNDASVPNRQRATQILRDVASVDECVSGLGYAYPARQFTVCVENVR